MKSVLISAVVLAAAAIASEASVGATARVTLAGVTLGAPVSSVVERLGTPGLVQTTDDGHEWRWFDAGGIDTDVVVDDALVVRQVLASQPEPAGAKQAPLVQPSEFPLLGATSAAAARFMRAAGATRQAEPEATVTAWRSGDDFVVLELRAGRVVKVRALDAASAADLGFWSGPRSAPYRAPRLVRQFATDYPSGHPKGVVVVEVRLSATGEVRGVSVLVSSGSPAIDAAETLSMRRSTFLPARCAGQPCEGVYLDREEYTD